MLAINSGIKIVATILAKNEEDIIGQMIEHHLSQGVSQIIFTDNNSTDNTRSIVEKFPEVVEIIDEKDDAFHQSKWVTRMAKMTCKLDPDWVIHLDADEFWGGLHNLRSMQCDSVSSEAMYLHPPTEEFSLNNMRFYLDFDKLPIPQESKIAHRPDPNIEILHGNHGIAGKNCTSTKKIYRHHFPIRSFSQWKSKASGHLSLVKTNSTCVRWENWYNSASQEEYSKITNLWNSFCVNQNKDDFISLIRYWSTDEMVNLFETNDMMPIIGEWPKERNEEQSRFNQRFRRNFSQNHSLSI